MKAMQAMNHVKLEQRYLKQFHSVDLSADFYYSNDMDITQPWPESFNRSHNVSEKYCWNHHLLQQVPSNWGLHLIHGFVGSRRLSRLFNSPEVILIGRRSARFAGTRFNRRGQDLDGNVANEVETEQIVYRRGMNSSITSFLHHRGSVPIFWSQDMGSVPQKPPIQIDHCDPWYQACGKHFKSLFERYGGPIIAFNLVKKNTSGEEDLGTAFEAAVIYLNQFLPAARNIIWKWVDIAKLRKLGHFGDEFNQECRDLVNLVGISSTCRKQTGAVRYRTIYIIQNSRFKCGPF